MADLPALSDPLPVYAPAITGIIAGDQAGNIADDRAGIIAEGSDL